MSFFKKVTEKPWLGDHTAFETVPGDGAATLKTRRLGLFIFIGVATALFALFTVAYVMRMKMGGWYRMEEPDILWLNTLILIAGSGMMMWASKLVRGGDVVRARRAFAFGGLAGILFIIGQVMAWQELIGLGYYAQSNPANAFFYIITGLHGLHLFGGLIAWGRALVRLRGDASPDDAAASIELCDYYWHFMLLVWMGLFLLMLTT